MLITSSLLINLSLVTKGKNISRDSENSALHIDSVTENVSFPPHAFFFFSCSGLVLVSDVRSG